MVCRTPLLVIRQPYEQNPRVSTWRKRARVREVEIARYEHAPFSLCRSPDDRVMLASQALVQNRMHVMAMRGEPRGSRCRQILVELQLHGTCAAGGRGVGAGRSSAADAAAKAITARTSSSFTLGNSRRMVATVSP